MSTSFSWVESVVHPDDPRINKWYDSLKDLKNGEAWVWHNEEPKIKRVQFRKRETLHATREYFRAAAWQQQNVKMMDVDAFVSKFKNVFEPKPKEQEQGAKPTQLIATPKSNRQSAEIASVARGLRDIGLKINAREDRHWTRRIRAR